MLDNILKVISNLQKRKGEGKMESQQLINFQTVQKKPVEVEACQLTQEIWCQLFNSESSTTKIGEYRLGAMATEDQQYFLIETLEDVDGQFHRAEINDWMIKGVKGEIYACKPDIFEATYNFVANQGYTVIGIDPAVSVQESSQDDSMPQEGFTPEGDFVKNETSAEIQTEEPTANEYSINGECVKV